MFGNLVEGKCGAACGCVTIGAGKLAISVERIKVMLASVRASQHRSDMLGDRVIRKASRKGARTAGAARGKGPSAHVGLLQSGHRRAHWLDLSPGRTRMGMRGDEPWKVPRTFRVLGDTSSPTLGGEFTSSRYWFLACADMLLCV